MSTQATSKKLGAQIGFLTLGVAIGAGFTLLARQSKSATTEKPEKLDDLFAKCEDLTCRLEREVKSWLAS